MTALDVQPPRGQGVSDITAREVAERLSEERDILVAAHENPDGDAVGSVVALTLMADRLGIPCRPYLPGTTPIPEQYRFLPALDRILRGPFPEVDQETSIYMLDCATPGRLDPDGLKCAGACLDLDHHPDNVGFGTHNLLVPSASSTTQILFDVFNAGGLAIDTEIGTALYVGLLTDTGRFQYGNTTPSAHRMAAELQEVGVDVGAVYRAIYESEAPEKARLIGRVLSRLELRLEGVLATSWLTADDFAEFGADESHTEGLIDELRVIRGVRVAALLRERPGGGDELKGSLRATDPQLDVSTIAHLQGGGGHRQAAGFSMRGRTEDALEWIEQQVRSLL